MVRLREMTGQDDINIAWKPTFDSQGDIRPWGRDFWTENFLGEVIIIGGGVLLGLAITLGLGLLLLNWFL